MTPRHRKNLTAGSHAARADVSGLLETGTMAVDPDLYFDLSMDELREVTRFALAPAEQATGLLGARVDPRIQAALEAARLFAAGRRRSKLQRTTALDAHRAAREATDDVARHAAAAAGDAAGSDPFAKADQVGHILRSTAHAALAVQAARGEAAAQDLLDNAVSRATPALRAVLRRYPPFPPDRNPVTQITSDLDTALRGA